MKKKTVSGILAAALVFAGSTVCGQAGEIRKPIFFIGEVVPLYRSIDDYYYASVAMEVSATMGAQSTQSRRAAANGDTRVVSMSEETGITGEIRDWGQAVFAGSDVCASLEKIPGKVSGSAPGFLSYQWEFYDSQGDCIKKTGGRYASVPEEAEGGYLLVQISVRMANNGWAVSNTASYVSVD